MARYDVYPDEYDGLLLLDCQADVLSYLSTRFVVPLLPTKGTPKVSRLNPVFSVNGEPYLLATHLASSMPARPLTKPLTSLRLEHDTIMNALDVLLTGV